MHFLSIRTLLLLASSTEICGKGVRKKQQERMLGTWPISRVLEHAQEHHETRIHDSATTYNQKPASASALASECALMAGSPPGVPLFDPCSAGAPKFEEICPNPLTSGFIYKPNQVKVIGCTGLHITGLRNTNTKLEIPIYGFKEGPSTCKAQRCACSWPGKTFVASSGRPLSVDWGNDINPRGTSQSGGPPPQGPLLGDYLLTSTSGQSVVDTSLHWAYSLHGYENYSIAQNGVPIITHLHGGHNDFQYDGNPEFFFTSNSQIVGPEWNKTNLLQRNGRIPRFVYDNSQPAALIWYHDHALGITRLNVYSGMAGFYVIRDAFDTGQHGNPLTLPTFPYETALAIQDRMFKANGELFYPAFPGDPAYEEFITDRRVNITNPTVLTEFFGDFMLVNGKIWPKMDVEPRHYRLRLLNGCDSRFLIIRFCLADSEYPTEFPGGPGSPACDETVAIPFYVIGSDQGLRFDGLPAKPDFTTLVVEPGARYDIVINFGLEGLSNQSVIMANLGPDSPFSGFIPPDPPVKNTNYFFTDRIMRFDVSSTVQGIDSFNASAFNTTLNTSPNFGRARVPTPIPSIRSVGLFEGLDEFGRLQPLLGTVYPAVDASNNSINWPNTEPYIEVGLNGTQMQGTMGWHEPATELPVLNTTEYWDIWNLSVDAHPVHLHLVHVEVVARFDIKWDSSTTDDNRFCDPNCHGNGTYLVTQPLVQHSEAFNLTGGSKVVNATMGDNVTMRREYFENAPLDVFVALPNQVTRIKATFDKPGRFVWHCHMLSHEDHEMMRIMEVVVPQ